MDTVNNTYPLLHLPASELSAFAVSLDFFIISLKNGELIHFIPDSVPRFYEWLIAHGVRDINQSDLNTIITKGKVPEPKKNHKLWITKKS